MTESFRDMKVDLSISRQRTKEGVVMATQVHKDSIACAETGDESFSAHDAIVTENRALKLGVYTADCAPVCFSDGVRLGIAHVGWPGLCLGLAEKTLKGFDQDTVEIYVGPHLHVFEIQKDHCYDAIAAKFGEEFFSHENGKILFRFRDAIASCLPPHAIFDERSTGTDLLLPSWRRDKTDMRIITVVGFR